MDILAYKNMKRSIIIFLLTAIGLGTWAQTPSREYDVLFHEALQQRLKGHHTAAFDLFNRCVEMNPQASEAFFFRAQYYHEMGDAETALSDFKKAADLDPDNLTLLESLAHAYINNDQYVEAIAVVEHMYDIDKSRQELLEMLYRLYIEEKDFEKAISVLDRMEIIDGKNETTTLAKSALYLQLDDTEKALAEVLTLTEKYPNDLNYRTLYAHTLIANDRSSEGLAILQDVLREEPDNTKAQNALRNYYISNEEKEQADSLTRCILLNAKTPLEDKINHLRQLIGESEQNGGDSTLVLQLFDEMLEQPDVDADIAEFRAAYMDLKKMPRDTVAQAYEYVLQLAPDRASARLHLVQQAWEDDDDQRIIDLCQAARQYNPDEMAFYYYQGMAYYRQENHDGALEAFKNGISVIDNSSSPEIVSDFYAVMGDLLFMRQQKKEAFAAYDSCLQWNADNIGCLNNYAYYLSLKNDRLKEAEEMSYKTIKAEPDNATYLDTYAWILFMEERYAEAKVYIEQALKNDENVGAVVTEHAGDIYAMNGETERAVELWQQALEQDPGNKLLTKKIKKRKYIKQK